MFRVNHSQLAKKIPNDAKIACSVDEKNSGIFFNKLARF